MTPTDRDTDALRDIEIPDPHEHQRATRRPGEAAFTLLMLAASLVLLWSAYGISGFEALSSPGTVPMATTFVMVIAAAMIALRTIRLPQISGETVAKDILPIAVILVAALLIAYAVLLKPLGFLPTSALFLIVAIKTLWRHGWAMTLVVSFGSLIGIYIVFRVIFTVLMPAGVVPEGEMLQFFRNIFHAGGL